MLSDTHTYILYNDAVPMHSQIVCTRRFLFTEEIETEVKDRLGGR